MVALKFVTRMARLGCQIAWELEIPSMKVQSYRDTMGPGRKSVGEVLAEFGGGCGIINL